MTRAEFEQLIIEAVDALPKSIRKKMKNVAIVLEDGEAAGKNLFGLYQGVPQTVRGVHYYAVLPDKITIYKRTIEDHVGDSEDLRRLVRRVVWHEIGHHFGFSETAIRRLEKKWEKEKKI
jgi:predicted Zn-dependent protease with MMP-like domain